MPDSPSNFSKVEYLTIFGTFIYGYVATRFLYGWGIIIRQRQSIRFSKEHLLWTVFMFFLLIDIWWGSWLKGAKISTYKPDFYISLISPLIFYLFSVLYLPSLDAVRADLKTYFNSISHVAYILYLFLFLSFFLNDYFLQDSPPIDYAVNAVGVILAIAGYFAKRDYVNRFILAVAFVFLFLHIHSLRTYQVEQHSIENFSLNEYLTIFSAFIFGAVASNFFSGWGTLIYRYRDLRINKEHFFWTLFAFILLMDVWWGQWVRSEAIAQSVYTFLLSLLAPFVFYFLSVVIFPARTSEGVVDFDVFYLSSKRIIFGFIGIILACNFIVALVLEQAPLFTFTNFLRIVGIVMALLCVVIRYTRFHRFVQLLAWVMLIIHIFKT